MDASRSALTRYEDFHGMLSDSVRMEAFKKAIDQSVKPGDVVVDLGAGTGILGFLAIQAGAEQVFAIEQSDSIDLARAVAAKNNMSDRIVFLNENSKDVTLPVKADVIVSETLGSFGVDENTLEFTIDARDRFLKPGGILIPQGLRLHLAPVESKRIYDKIDFWREIQGIDFTPAREVFGRKIMVESILPRQMLAEPALFQEIDLHKTTSPASEGKVLFRMERNGTIHGVGGWFELDLTGDIRISTAPGQADTHWQQAFFPFLEPIKVIRGDYLELTLSVSPQSVGSDNTRITYDYRCSQLAKEPGPDSQSPGRNSPCPCGSGRKHKNCCG
jgi:protein arginine N-methyltransferase 1